jgi:hypothetical protein
MSIGIRTLMSKVKKLEQKTGVRDVNKFYNSLTEAQVDALCSLTYEQLDAGEMMPDEDQIGFVMDYLDCEEREAKYLINTSRSFPPDPDHERMTDEELWELIIKTREEIKAMDAEETK